MVPALSFVAIAFFWMFSPESLVFLGNAAGQGGVPAIAALFTCGVLIVSGILVLVTDARQSHQGMEAGAGWPTVVLGLAGIAGTTVFAATGILVAAGFTFNEVFWHRFPNFGFAFLLLVVAYGCQYLPLTLFRRVQVILMMIVVMALVLLVVTGILVASPPLQEAAGDGPKLLPLLSLMFLFVGFEQVARASAGICRSRVLIAIYATILLLLAAWMAVGADFVAAHRLSGSTIPHMLAAGAILGDGGRLVMGAAVICGGLAAVNALLQLSSRFVRNSCLHPDLAPPDWCLPTVWAVLIGLCLYGGLAGSDHLEWLIRSGLVLWLAYGAMGLMQAGCHRRTRWPATLLGCGGGVLLLLCCLAVLMLSGEGVLQIKQGAAGIALSAVVVLLCRIGPGVARSLRKNL